MRPVHFGVIGCGMFARQTHLPNLLALEDARLHACCDLEEANLAACETFRPAKLTRDFSAVINDPEVDILVIATTEHFRLPIIEAALRARKPIYCEKPLADSLANALLIEALVQESGLPFCVGHNRRCSPAMVVGQELFTSHMRRTNPCSWRFERQDSREINIGPNPAVPVVAMRINDDWMSWKAVHLQSELNRRVGLVLSEGTHFADLANWFIGSIPISVFCTGSGILNHVMIIHYANGGMASLTMAGTGSLGYPKELLEAFGNAGAVVVDHMLEVRTAGLDAAPAVQRFSMLGDRHPDRGDEGGLSGWLAKKRAACEEASSTGDPLRQFTAEPDKGHQRMLAEFIREVRGERGPVCSVADAVLATRVCLAAARSYLEHRTVLLSEITAEAPILS